MAHSPLFRTIMRGSLDERSASLTRYEIAMEGICTDGMGLRHAVVFDEEAWHDYRKRHELKAPREARAEARRKEFWRRVRRDDQRTKNADARVLRYSTFKYPNGGKKVTRRAAKYLPLVRSKHYLGMIRMAKELPKVGNTSTCASYCDWRPPPRPEILRAEAFNEILVLRRRGTPAKVWGGGVRGCGYEEGGEDDTNDTDEDEDEDDKRARKNQAGLLHPRSLRDKLTPDYVPKPHLRRARERLLDRSAEFASGVRARVEAGTYKLPVAEGGCSDDSRDNSEHSSDDERRTRGRKKRAPRGATASKAPKKRKTAAVGAVAAAIASAAAKKPGTKTKTATGPGPKPFVKPFDSRAHDWLQLRTQARHRLALCQQKLPRVEQPLWGSRRSAAAETGEDEQNYAAAAAAAGVTSQKTDADEESGDDSGSDSGAAKDKRKKSKSKAEKAKQKKLAESSGTKITEGKAASQAQGKKNGEATTKAETGLTPEEEKALEQAQEMLRAIGVQLPTRLPKDNNGAKSEGDGGSKAAGKSEAKAAPDRAQEKPEEDGPFGEIDLEEAQKYRKWRRTSAKALFEARNRYLRCRMYSERTRDQEITLTVRELLKFWKNRI